MNDAIIYATLSAFAPDVLATIQHQVAYGITPDRIAEIFGGDAGNSPRAQRNISRNAQPSPRPLRMTTTTSSNQ